MNALKDFFKKEPVRRAIRTFLQAAVGYFATAWTTGYNAELGFTKQVVIGLIVSSIAAGLSAAMNIEKEE